MTNEDITIVNTLIKSEILLAVHGVERPVTVWVIFVRFIGISEKFMQKKVDNGVSESQNIETKN